MKSLPCLTILTVAVLVCWHCGASGQDRSAGLNFAYNEFSATFQLPVREKESLRLSVNLDMTRVIEGDYIYPGVSADAVYLFQIGRKDFLSGEAIRFFAGPGAVAGYVRNRRGQFGVMASLTGCVGFEYLFRVPVSFSLSLEPNLGIHLYRDRFGYMNMDFYEAGLIYSAFPHFGIKYWF